MRRGSENIEEGREMGKDLTRLNQGDIHGISVARVGATDAAVLRRAKGAQAALHPLIYSKILSHGMDARKATEMRSVFLK